MRAVAGTDSRQMTMGVWSVEDEVAQDSPARFIEVFVESLELERLGFRHAVPAGTGRPAYHPGDLLKLYLYGYLNKIRSSRKLMRECGRNVELWFLLNRLQPDFRTIADFRKEHRKLLGKIFVIFARACREMKLMDGETLCLDGTTIRASNGRKQSTSVELSRKKLEPGRSWRPWSAFWTAWTKTTSTRIESTTPSRWIWTRIICSTRRRCESASPFTKGASRSWRAPVEAP